MSRVPTKRAQVGELRPSQLLTTFGIGSVIELPYISAMVMGLDDWHTEDCLEVAEDRLLTAVQKIRGTQVKALRNPPRAPDAGQFMDWWDPANHIGVPVAPFPRWLVCSACRVLAPISSGFFTAKQTPYRPDQTRYVHPCRKGRAPEALPARFVVACSKGHLDDFPWKEFVHGGKTTCEGTLRMYEVGPSGEASEVVVKCEGCGKTLSMARAFETGAAVTLPNCRGRRPHLRDHAPEGCDQNQKPILLGASNTWFPVIVSALSIPSGGTKLQQLVEDNWAVLQHAIDEGTIKFARLTNAITGFGEATDAEILAEVEAKKAGRDSTDEDATDLKTPEWNVLSAPARAKPSRDFRLKQEPMPDKYAPYFDKVVLVERLREVRASIGFTRIESSRDFDSAFEIPKDQLAPISRRPPTWLPATETRGEGIFIQFSEAAVSAWEARVSSYSEAFFTAHQQWRSRLGIPEPEKGFPGVRFILLHSFAHALLRQLSVECGYTASAIAERIYAKSGDDAMAGVLIYTAAADSEGTLGGLCSLGNKERLERHLDQALERVRLCASDPLCSENAPNPHNLHGAACHACSFLPETSCERGNKYLDRAVLVDTLDNDQLSFFTGIE